MASKFHFISFQFLHVYCVWIMPGKILRVKRIPVVCYVSQANKSEVKQQNQVSSYSTERFPRKDWKTASSATGRQQEVDEDGWKQDSLKEGASSKHPKSRSSISPKRSFLMRMKEMAIDDHSYQTVKGWILLSTSLLKGSITCVIIISLWIFSDAVSSSLENEDKDLCTFHYTLFNYKGKKIETHSPSLFCFNGKEWKREEWGRQKELFCTSPRNSLLFILSTSFFPEEQLLFVVFSSLTFEGKKIEEGGNKNKENRDR